jgi:hypothetical protein
MSAVRMVLLQTAVLMSPALCLAVPTETLSDPETIMEKVRRTIEQQKADLCGYSVNRTYVLTNKHLSHEAKMFFQVTYDKATGKKFKLLSEENSNGFIRHNILELIDGEIASGNRDSEKAELDDRNYRFSLLGQEPMNGRLCYKIGLKPRLKNKYLLDGFVWVDASQFALIRLKGQPAKNVSFWVSHSDFEQDFAPVQSFWLPSYNHSIAHITFFGEVSLAIEYSGYEVQACPNQNAPTARALQGH